ncbi:MAG TPA: hypothetical protein VEM27_02660 [Gemmatimonadales bacterium]|nr:hypothetical protein [Gemmatimonadales bacterium]
MAELNLMKDKFITIVSKDGTVSYRPSSVFNLSGKEAPVAPDEVSQQDDAEVAVNIMVRYIETVVKMYKIDRGELLQRVLAKLPVRDK